MKFDVMRTSDYFHKHENSYEIELNTLEEFINWCKSTNHEVIVNTDNLELEIYDDWRE